MTLATHAILKSLEQAKGDPMCTKDVAISISTACDQFGAVPQDYNQPYLSVRYRLKDLAKDEVIERYYYPIVKRKVYWKLARPEAK
jgi:hypothetical protein